MKDKRRKKRKDENGKCGERKCSMPHVNKWKNNLEDRSRKES